jgi:hypothetical protein
VPGLIDIAVALIVASAAFAAGAVMRSRHRKRAVPLRLRVDDEVTVVLSGDGRHVLELASAVVVKRKVGSKLFKIELLERGASTPGAEVARFASPPDDPGFNRAYTGFVGACGMRARSALRISGFRGIRLTLENKISGPGARRFEETLRPKQLLPLGIYLD